MQLGIGHERLPREPCSPCGGARALPRRRLRGPSPVPGSPLWAHSSRLQVVCRVSLGVAGCSPRNSDTERPCTHSPFFLLSWERTPQTPRPSSHEDRLPFSCRGSVGPRFSGLSAPRPLPRGRAADTGSLGVRPPPRSTLMWRCPLARVGTSFLLAAALRSPTAGPAPALRRHRAFPVCGFDQAVCCEHSRARLGLDAGFFSPGGRVLDPAVGVRLTSSRPSNCSSRGAVPACVPSHSP